MRWKVVVIILVESVSGLTFNSLSGGVASSFRFGPIFGGLLPLNHTALTRADASVSIGLDSPLAHDISSVLRQDGDNKSAIDYAIGEEGNSNESSQVSKVDDEAGQIIGAEEMKTALANALTLMNLSKQEILDKGWNEVFHSDTFSLFKRRILRADGSKNGPVEYLMTGQFDDISPKTFLTAQLDREKRILWDKTMKDMSQGSIFLGKEDIGTMLEVAKDLIYYRTKWPWPLKDRDYALARRCL